MKKPPCRTPKYRRQKRPHSVDEAFVKLNGRRHYVGEYDSPESTRGVDRQRRSAPLNKNDIILRFHQYAEEYYRSPDGTPTSEVKNIRVAMRVEQPFGSRSPLS